MLISTMNAEKAVKLSEELHRLKANIRRLTPPLDLHRVVTIVPVMADQINVALPALSPETLDAVVALLRADLLRYEQSLKSEIFALGVVP